MSAIDLECTSYVPKYAHTWWRHQMEAFSTLLAFCAGNSPMNSPTQRPVTHSFDVFFDLRLNERLSKQSWGWGFETLSWSLWRHCNVHAGLICVTLLWLYHFWQMPLIYLPHYFRKWHCTGIVSQDCSNAIGLIPRDAGKICLQYYKTRQNLLLGHENGLDRWERALHV